MPVTINTGKIKYKDSNDEFQTLDAVGGIEDVQVNGASVVSNGVANVPVAALNTFGVVKADSYFGVYTDANGRMVTNPSDSGTVKLGVNAYRPLVPSYQHMSTFYGLAKAAGADERFSTLSVGQYTEAAKSAISTMLNGSVSVTGSTPSITALPGIRYICGEVLSLNITLPNSGIIDVVFESGSTPTVLTITPPTGQTLKWTNGFDPASLDANTTYEINIADGLGVTGSWT